MTPSEINIEVAKRLGWTETITGTWLKHGIYAHDEPGKDVPDYCTDIKAAWEIIEGLKCGWEMKTTRFGVDFRIYDEAGVYPSETAATAPMAICLAFLKLK